MAREYDIVLFGATGFTGELTAGYLAAHMPAGARWALAGRDLAKLEALRERLAATESAVAQLPILIADSADELSLQALAGAARVVISTVGPYLFHGEQLIAACARAGTDYVDLCGEPELVDQVYLRYHTLARESGARLVHSCGFDSVVFDLGVLFTIDQIPESEQAAIAIQGFMLASGSISGGTFRSAVNAIGRLKESGRASRQRRSVERHADDGRLAEGRRVRGIARRPHREPLAGGWVVSAPTIDPQHVRRSARLDERYGPDFSYAHYLVTRSLIRTIALLLGVGVLATFAQLGATRSWLLRLRRAGTGPSEAKRAKSFFRVRFLADIGGNRARRMLTEVSGGDPGYGETSKMLAESALCLAFDAVPAPGGGQWTPAVALGRPLIDRLIKAGIAFRVLEQQEGCMGSLAETGAEVTEPGQYLRAYGPAALEWAASYLERVGTLPVLAQVQPGELTSRLPASAPERGESFDEVLRDVEEILLPGVTHWQHPRYFAYFPSATSAPAILADMLAATLNTVGFLWRSSPAATELEGVVCSWVAQLLGLPEGWHGHIEGGGSLSTMTAVIAAREFTGRGVLVCSEDTHSSAAKAAQMVGMQTRTVPCDADGRMRVGALGDLSDAAVVVATVGTTGRGAVDPVPEIAEACAAAGAWMHVDAAYAGTAMVCPEFRWAFEGVERADSVVVNAHKWMLTPIDCSLLWTSRPDAFRDAFSMIPEYLRTPSLEDDWSLNDYGPALGRRFRALKLWAVLRCYGREGLQQHVRAGVEMAAAFESWVQADPDWEIVAARHFGLVCLRHVGDDDLNKALLERVNASGDAFLSHTVINGRYVLRLAAGGLLTTLADMEQTWQVLKREAAALG